MIFFLIASEAVGKTPTSLAHSKQPQHTYALPHLHLRLRLHLPPSFKMARALALASCLASLALALGVSPPTPPPIVQLSGRGVLDVIGPSDAMFLLVLMDVPASCEERCEIVQGVIDKVNAQAAGMFRIATTNARDPMALPGMPLIEAFKVYNVTNVPAGVIYGVGPKRLEAGFVIQADEFARFVGRGAGDLYARLRAFLPSVVERVSGGGFDSFAGIVPSLPRVLVLTDKKEVSPLTKSLAVAFAGRGVVGQALRSDAVLTSALGLEAGGSGPLLLVSPPGPFPAKLKKGSLPQWAVYDGSAKGMAYGDLEAFLHGALPGVSPPTLTSPTSFDALCGGGGVQICFIAVLPEEDLSPLALEEAREDPESPAPWATFARVAGRAWLRVDYASAASDGTPSAVRQPLAFGVVSGEEQPGWAATLKASTASPSLIAISPRKKMFVTYKGGSFSDAALTTFVLDVMDVAQGVAKKPKRGAAAGDDDEEEGIVLERLEALPTLKEQEVAAPVKKKAKKGGKKTSKKSKAAKDAAPEVAAEESKPFAEIDEDL